ncbi:phosphoribosylamine--glycine ligase [Devosia limi DSM 17137]|uniref:Phosphoribosylamine--glycine ligase n=1 Tax=Devosia limi DSM 17137 TaxID=1121477 RepID=A0A0F5LPP3_9HYPH|nr:phosphoribosylamine--glycine ligase [Devosia limi]KKB84094.1 phosphoribosylamine--glycine ligase [Devosia limi DSM 17137]SHF91230.1 phosphoribosylamine--glycine ligase [Devosia limi DSM 17137]
MRVLVIGSGGREHALAWKIAQSPHLTKLFIAPGNGGTGAVAENLPVDITDHAAIIALCQTHQIDFVVVGPDAQVVAGLGDDIRAAGFTCFCPSKAAGQLEGSKGFTKALCDEMGIPTAAYGRFTTEAAALAHVYAHGAPIVVKADGLAAGKGVTVAMSVEAAEEAIIDCFSGSFGEAGAEVVIEEFMEGEEVSLFVLCDGKDTLLLTTAQDHKRAFDGDTGPNTGGMGAYSPAAIMSDALLAEVMDSVIAPTVKGLAARGTPYQGVLYAGLMLTADGPKLVEYNARFGDPETQVLVMRLKSDLLDLLHATATGTLAGKTTEWSDDVALTVIMATKGYPGPYAKGSEIRGTEGLDSPEIHVFHAGTQRDGTRLLAAGGRVLNVTALGPTVQEAQSRAYASVDKIDWPDGFCRRDIGWRAIARSAS